MRFVNKAQKEVDKELKKLDEMGSLNEIKRSDFEEKEEIETKVNNGDVLFTLKDLYQFLKFDGEYPEGEAEILSDNYKEMEEELVHRIYRIQHSTVGKALKRVLKRPKTRDVPVQANYINYEEEISKLNDELDGVYK